VWNLFYTVCKDDHESAGLYSLEKIVKFKYSKTKDDLKAPSRQVTVYSP